MFSPQIPSSQPGRPGIGNVAIRTTRRELDSRSADGIQVQLLWHPLDGHVSVAVNNSETGEEFELVVPARPGGARRLPPPLRLHSDQRPYRRGRPRVMGPPGSEEVDADADCR